MNKFVIALLLSVCLLGIALIFLNERLGNEVPSTVVEKVQTENPPTTNVAPMPQSPMPSEKKADNPSKDIAVKKDHEKKTPDTKLPQPVPVAEKAPVVALPENEIVAPSPDVTKITEEVTPAKDLLPTKAEEQKQIPDIATDKEEQQKPEVASAPHNEGQVALAPEKAKEPQALNASDVKHQENDKKVDTPAKSLAEPKKEVKAEKAQGDTAKNDQSATSAEKTTSEKQEKKTGGKLLRFEVLVYKDDAGATVRLRTTNQLRPTKTKRLSNPERGVVDVIGELNIDAKDKPRIPANSLVSDVRFQKISSERTRIVIDLKEKPSSMKVTTPNGESGIDVRFYRKTEQGTR